MHGMAKMLFEVGGLSLELNNSMQHFEALAQGLRTATLQQILKKQSQLVQPVLGTSGSHASAVGCPSHRLRDQSEAKK